MRTRGRYKIPPFDLVDFLPNSLPHFHYLRTTGEENIIRPICPYHSFLKIKFKAEFVFGGGKTFN